MLRSLAPHKFAPHIIAPHKFAPHIIAKRYKDLRLIIIEMEEKKGKGKGNEKRIESCKKVGKEKKLKGHKREIDFRKQYNMSDIDKKIEYSSTSDNIIDTNHSIISKLKENLNVSGNNVSNKSGENIQFTLGKIPELDCQDNLDVIKSKQMSRKIFEKYLKKSESDSPADLLVYKDTKTKKWIFFKMDDIVDYIVDKCEWRKLETGRLKGDFKDNTKKGTRQYLTYEYRTNHKSYFLGLNGKKGIDFINLLMDKEYGIKYYTDDFNY
jgi:hypothetical protein